MTYLIPPVLPRAARESRQIGVLTSQARKGIIEETLKHVQAAIQGSPMDAAKALSRLAILEGDAEAASRTPEENGEE